MLRRIVRAETLLRFSEEALVEVGVPQTDAKIMAHNMVEADLKGVDTHGTAKLRDHITYIRKRDLNAEAKIEVVRETGATAVINGDRAAIGLAAHKATEMAIAKAKENGIGAVAVRNVGRCGALSTFTAMIAENDLIGMMTAQGEIVVPPLGGRTRLLNTSPWSFAIPAGEQQPIVLDMSSTEAARSKLTMAMKEQRKIPFGWLLNEAGEPTDNPADMAKGIQTWIGGAKGYGMAVVDQVLAGILASAALVDIEPKAADVHRRGHFVMAIDPAAFIDLPDFKREVDELIRTLKESERLDEEQEILLPGERSARMKEERLKNGIPLRTVHWKELSSLCNDIGVLLVPDEVIEIED